MNYYLQNFKGFFKKIVIIYLSVFGIWVVFALIGTYIGLPAILGGITMIGYWLLILPTKVLLTVLLPGSTPTSLSATEGNIAAIWFSATIVNIILCSLFALALSVIKSLLSRRQKSV